MVDVLEEHRQARLRQEEERRRLRVNKKKALLTAVVWHLRYENTLVNGTLSIGKNSELTPE